VKPTHDYPIIRKFQVIPVAGIDSMKLKASGIDTPCFTRTIVVIEDSAGHSGVSETSGSAPVYEALNKSSPFLIGRNLGDYKNMLNHIEYAFSDSYNLKCQSVLFPLSIVKHLLSAIETAMLDLLGKTLNVSIASLIGGGQQRHKVALLSNLYFVGDRTKVSQKYRYESGDLDDWYRLRNEEVTDADTLVRLAEAAYDQYGFTSWKLHGGVLEAWKEIESVKALACRFPSTHHVSFDAGGIWSLDEALVYGQELKGKVTSIESPCHASNGYSLREVTAEFKNKLSITTASPKIITDLKDFRHAISLKALDICLVDPHYWTMQGSVEIAKLCNEWGVQWNTHSKNHFDVSFAMYVQVAAAAQGQIAAIDTHWIWQQGSQQLTHEPLKIESGAVCVPEKPGLGVDIDMDQVYIAHELYKKLK